MRKLLYFLFVIVFSANITFAQEYVMNLNQGIEYFDLENYDIALKYFKDANEKAAQEGVVQDNYIYWVTNCMCLINP
ncbi:MAG: hypothetical protein JEZ09_20180 [Salinivirgaceae bacterium]|nr:hypothetical protein [Salinivirgaceae bacterium]